MKKYFQFTIDRNTFFYLLLFLIYVFLTPSSGHEWDMHCWLEWTKNAFNYGLKGVYRNYESTTDYLPLYHYFLYAFAKFQGSIANIEKNIYYLKIITLVFDFIGGIFLTRFIHERYKDSNKVLFYSMLLFLNIAYFYNTMIWGQVDGIMTTFIFLSLFYGIKEKVLPSVIFFLLALNFKLQSIIFLPVVLLTLLPAIIQHFSLKNLVAWLGIPLLIEILILLPFLHAGVAEKIWNIVTNSIGKSPVVSLNAYNMWHLLIPGDLKTVSDTTAFIGMSYKNWGLLLFFFFGILALLPLMHDVYSILIRKSKENIPVEKIFLEAALIPLLFFFFNTEMHERYSHAAILLVAAYSILSKKFLPYILVSLGYVLNLEAVLRYFKLNHYGTMLFDPRFVAALFFISIVVLFFDLFKRSSRLPKIKF